MPLRKTGLAVLPFLVLLPEAAVAQLRVSPERVAAARQAFESEGSGPLRCSIHEIRAALTFGFRFRSGYMIELPLSQFQAGGTVKTLVRVIPDGGAPVFFRDTRKVPEPAAPNLSAEFSGAFLTGEGTYSVEARVEDNRQRVCRGKWHIQSRLSGSERELKPALAPGAVAEAGWRHDPAPGPRDGVKIGRLTILLHAASRSANAARLPGRDIQMLVDSLGSLLQQLPARSVRLVVFNLHQQAVLLRKDDLTAGGLDEVAENLSHAELAVVDYRSLQNQDQAGGMLWRLIQAESAGPRPDGIILMGAKTENPVERAGAADPRPDPPPLFYLQYRVRQLPVTGVDDRPPATGVRLGRAGGARAGLPGSDPPAATTSPDFLDGIGDVVGKLRGETIAIWSPHDLAGAVRRIAARAESAL